MILGLCALLVGGASRAVPTPKDDLIGEMQSYTTGANDTLLDIARQFDLGFVEIRAANPEVDPWLPGAGRRLTVPTQLILPMAPRQGIVINLAELRLYYFPRSGPVETHPIGIGSAGIETPVGQTQVVRKMPKPTWYPPPSIRAQNPDLPESVPPGPDNPMGAFALYLAWRGYAIHGTNKPWGVGRRVSHGCIRLYPEDIARLYPVVPIGTKVTVLDQPAKLGWHHGELYLEVHPTQEQADEIESGEPMSIASIPNLEDMVAAAAGAATDRIDWYAVHLAEQRRTGVPLRITRAAIGH